MPELCRNEEIRVAAELQLFNRPLGRLTGMARHEILNVWGKRLGVRGGNVWKFPGHEP